MLQWTAHLQFEKLFENQQHCSLFWTHSTVVLSMEKRGIRFISVDAQGKSDKEMVESFYAGTVLFNMPLVYFHLVKVIFLQKVQIRTCSL